MYLLDAKLTLDLTQLNIWIIPPLKQTFQLPYGQKIAAAVGTQAELFTLVFLKKRTQVTQLLNV